MREEEEEEEEGDGGGGCGLWMTGGKVYVSTTKMFSLANYAMLLIA